MDFIKIPFGYLLDWLSQFANNYGLALILFSLIVKMVLFPMNAKSKKSMLKMSRIAPLAKALEAKYADNQQKYQQELMKLYKEEGVSTTGGCLWSFLPLLILLPLYYVIREPLTYVLHIPAETSAAIVELIKGQEGVVLSASEFFAQLEAASYLGQFQELIAENFAEVAGKIRDLQFPFLGINLAQVPDFKIWSWAATADWNQIGLFLLPILSGGSNLLTSVISQKLNGSVATNDKGEKDEAAAKANKSMNTMLYLMPLFSVYIGFTMPAAVTVYWIAQAVFSLIIDTALTLHYRKIYDAEDEVRRQKARLAQLEEEARERVRAERRAANPDGIVENTSKKKLERKEREEKENQARRYAAEKAGIDLDAEKELDREKCPSGIKERPYCRGRAYDPNRYNKANSTEEASE